MHRKGGEEISWNQNWMIKNLVPLTIDARGFNRAKFYMQEKFLSSLIVQVALWPRDIQLY